MGNRLLNIENLCFLRRKCLTPACRFCTSFLTVKSSRLKKLAPYLRHRICVTHGICCVKCYGLCWNPGAGHPFTTCKLSVNAAFKMQIGRESWLLVLRLWTFQLKKPTWRWWQRIVFISALFEVSFSYLYLFISFLLLIPNTLIVIFSCFIYFNAEFPLSWFCSYFIIKCV